MKSIEEFFKNRISFISHLDQPIPYACTYISKNVFNPEHYSIDFLKKVKPFCYYLYSNLDQKYGNWHTIEFFLISVEDEYSGLFVRTERIIQIFDNANWGEDDFLSDVDQTFDDVKTKFCSKIPLQPFKIMVQICKYEINECRMLRGEEEEEEREEEQVINAGKTFKSNECVICLTNPPNVLFCNCGHLCLCVECDKTKSLDNCPICKTENVIKRTI